MTTSRAALLRAWRERALLSQEELAHLAGLGVRTVRRLESGEIGQPRGDSLRRLADALRLTDQERARLVAPPQDLRNGTTERRPVIRQLPAGLAGFVGRFGQLRELEELLSADDRPKTVVISAISGMAGVGKTALAVHWAHTVADRFPDGQLYVNLRGFDPGDAAVMPARAVRGFLDALGVLPQRIPADTDAQAALYRSLLDGRRMLVLLDNARNADQIRPLLPGSRGCLVVVTSRDRLTGLIATDGAHSMLLDVLTHAEALQLLATRIGTERLAAESGTVEQIIQGCGCLPLALAIVAARAATHPHLPLAALAEQLGHVRQALDALDAGDPASNLRSVFSWSYQRLSLEAQNLFRLLGLHPGPDFTVAAAASLAGIPVAEAGQAMRELLQAHLVAEPKPGRYTLHDLLRAYAVELSPGGDTAAVTRLLDHYLHTADHASLRLLPHQETQSLPAAASGVTSEIITTFDLAWDWFTAEFQVLMAVTRLAAAEATTKHPWQLAHTLTVFLDRQGHWLDWVSTQRMALSNAEHLDDLGAQAFSHRSLAAALGHLRRAAEAETHLRRAYELYHSIADAVGQGHCLRHMAKLFEDRGCYVEAVAHSRRSLSCYVAADHLAGKGRALNALGWHLGQLGEHEEALVRCEQALQIGQTLGDRDGQADAWDSLGYNHQRLGNHADAIDCYQHAVELYRHLGWLYEVADSLRNLGDAHQAAHHHDAALGAWREAATVFVQLDHPEAEEMRAKISCHEPA